MGLTYKDAGVDIEAGDALVERIKPFAARTLRPEVVSGVGGFGGLFAIPPGKYREPVLVSGTDGVGTKLKIAIAAGKHDTVGIDLVAMSVNDVITTGARPLFFLDYFACGKLDVNIAEQVISGIAEGCRQSGCALLGGETAEHPGGFADGEYELAGFAVGVVSRRGVLGPQRVKAGDRLLAVASSGLHSNGFSLARRVLLELSGLRLDQKLPELDGASVGEALLVPTKIYARAVKALQSALGADLHALCHITGGGLPGNLPRVLPKGTLAKITEQPPVPAIFKLIEARGPVEKDEMRRTFNLGVGLVVVVSAAAYERAREALVAAGEQVFALGAVEAADDGAEPSVVYVEG
jgi:phosphoribosylformylglycinamidine cyclo-ligase